ncbi:MAG: 1-acyl-sn-glycerol-3-phosphate acyltransferase [Acidobacteria bacterium]|nr:1-acyl-sn-glycerol-3-phosphate acyltransferase [Acidobacteriota bacterium]
MTTEAGNQQHPKTIESRDGRLPRRAFEYFSRAVFRIYAPLEVMPGEPLPSEPFLLCSNHSSHLDSAVLMVAADRSFESFRLLAAADYFDPLSTTGRLTRAVLNIVAIDRAGEHSARLRRTIAECRELIRSQQVSLIAFPEGTRSTGGVMLPFKRGAAFLALALGVPVVPAYIDGARRSLPKGSWIPKPTRIRVQFGPTIRPEEWGAIHGQKARNDYVSRELERRIADLARAATRGARAGSSGSSS